MLPLYEANNIGVFPSLSFKDNNLDNLISYIYTLSVDFFSSSFCSLLFEFIELPTTEFSIKKKKKNLFLNVFNAEKNMDF